MEPGAVGRRPAARAVWGGRCLAGQWDEGAFPGAHAREPRRTAGEEARDVADFTKSFRYCHPERGLQSESRDRYNRKDVTTLAFHLRSRGNYAPTSLSNTALLRTVSVDPLSTAICRLRKSASTRVTVSREVPIICAISSWVSASLTLGSACCGLPEVHSSSSRARRSGAECDRPRLRICW